MRLKAKRREKPPLPAEYIYAERDELGRWTAAGRELSESQFLEEWEPLGDFPRWQEPEAARSRVREALRARADRLLVWLINWANRARRVTAPEPVTYVPTPGAPTERVLAAPEPVKAPAPVAGEVIE